MLEYSLESLLDAFDNTAADGTLEFAMPKDAYLDPDEPKTRASIARQLIESFFHGQCLALVRFDLVKSFLKEVLVELSQTDEGHWVVNINFAKLMLLPCEAPAKELAELRTLFAFLKDWMLLDPTRIMSAQICNERDAHSKVYGSIKVHFRENLESTTPNRALEANVKLDELVTGSPLIQAYLRQVALALGKMGPYSWATIQEEQLFGYGRGPWTDWFHAQYKAKQAAKQATGTAAVNDPDSVGTNALAL
jgi:hypothetical protein